MDELSNSDTDSFKSFNSEPNPEDAPARIPSTTPNTRSSDTRFSQEEEAELLKSSNDLKSTANAHFGRASYSDAIGTYSQALSFCPAYLDYDVAVLNSNIAACHIKLAEWKEAVESATKGLDCLERLDPTPKQEGKKEVGKAVESVVEEVDDEQAEIIEALNKSGKTLSEVRRLRVKALLRRAKGRMEVGGWASLQGAEDDYRQLSSMPELSTLDRKTVETALRTLGPRLETAKQREMADMMDKLKGLGNGILKPFGLSTDNFQFTKDESSGGYSMQFNQNPKG